MSSYSNSVWETPLFYVSPERQICMNRQVSQCTPLPSGDLPPDNPLLPLVMEKKKSKHSKNLCAQIGTCCPVYTTGGYKNPFPDYMIQMKGDNDFYFRQDACKGSFLPYFPPDPTYNAMDYLYGAKKK
jgi:hypothetical protein